MTKVQTPEEIAKQRSITERKLEQLDDAEQAWYDMPRERRLTELFHAAMCKSNNHYSFQNDKPGYCPFDEEDWDADTHITKNRFLERLNAMIRALPDTMSDEQMVELFAALKKAVES